MKPPCWPRAARAEEAAAAFVKFLASPGAAGTWEKAKLEPASSYQPKRASPVRHALPYNE